MAEKNVGSKYPLVINTEFDKFRRFIVTKNYVFYVDQDGESALMYDRNMKLLSDNYFAVEELESILEDEVSGKKRILWASKNASENIRLTRKERGLNNG